MNMFDTLFNCPDATTKTCWKDQIIMIYDDAESSAPLLAAYPSYYNYNPAPRQINGVVTEGGRVAPCTLVIVIGQDLPEDSEYAFSDS